MFMRPSILRFSLVFLLAPLSCITYRDFPEAYYEEEHLRNTNPRKFYIRHNTLSGIDLGGHAALLSQLKYQSNLGEVEVVYDIPPKGLFIDITTENKDPGILGSASIYISLSTLTLFPGFSTEDGYRIKCDVYMDGAKQTTKEYVITRKVGVWIILAPLLWVNALTYSEEGAFRAVGRALVHDASL